MCQITSPTVRHNAGHQVRALRKDSSQVSSFSQPKLKGKDRRWTWPRHKMKSDSCRRSDRQQKKSRAESSSPDGQQITILWGNTYWKGVSMEKLALRLQPPVKTNVSVTLSHVGQNWAGYVFLHLPRGVVLLWHHKGTISRGKLWSGDRHASLLLAFHLWGPASVLIKHRIT